MNKVRRKSGRSTKRGRIGARGEIKKIDSAIGRFLSKIRSSGRISLNDWALLLGCDQSEIEDIEVGRKGLSLDSLVILCGSLGEVLECGFYFVFAGFVQAVEGKDQDIEGFLLKRIEEKRNLGKRLQAGREIFLKTWI